MTEEEIQDLTDRVFLLKEKIESGKMKIASHLFNGFLESFEKIRLRADGLVDPSTVDGRIRASALAIRAMQYREELKNAGSLVDVQMAYFRILFDQFGEMYGMMIKSNSSPHKASSFFSEHADLVDDIINSCDDFFAGILEFWANAAEIGLIHLQDGEQLKANFAGDLFPSYEENSVSIAGLYIDTIVLPCPIVRTMHLKGHMPNNEFVRVLLKHIFTAMTYRDLAIEDIEPNIVVILPNQQDCDIDSKKSLVERSMPLTLRHASCLFDRDFESIEHFLEYCTSLKNIDQVLSELKRPDRLLFDTEWKKNPKSQLENAMTSPMFLPSGMDKNSPGMYIFSACLSRIPQANGALENSMALGGTPLINAKTSWEYYTWLLEYKSDKTMIDDEAKKNMHIVHALTSESDNELAWLGNVPTSSILKIRRNGLADEVRGLLGEGIDDLIKNKSVNYFQTADRITSNLDIAFRKHQKKFLEAKKEKLKLYGIDIGGCAVVGTIAVAAAITANPILGATAAMISLAGVPNIKDIRTKFKAQSDARKEYERTPTGILFSHIK